MDGESKEESKKTLTDQQVEDVRLIRRLVKKVPSSSLKNFALFDDLSQALRVKWLLRTQIGGQVEDDDSSEEGSHAIQEKLDYAAGRWEAGFACYKAFQAELDRRAEEKRRRARRAKEGQNELTGIMVRGWC